MAAQLKLVEEGEQQDLLAGVAKDPVLEVFEYWKALMEKQQSQLGPRRRKAVTLALGMGYTIDNLRLAIVGCKYDSWSQGNNDRDRKFDDLELICRDETRIDRFIDLGYEYMKKVQARDLQQVAAEQSRAEAVKMPDYVRSKLDALFAKYRKGDGK